MSRQDSASTVEAVLGVVELIPPGSVVSYGDIGALVGTSARRVGTVMSEYGHAVAWWRVVRANGELPTGLAIDARPHWQLEGIATKENGMGCRIDRHHADLAALASRWEESTARRVWSTQRS